MYVKNIMDKTKRMNRSLYFIFQIFQINKFPNILQPTVYSSMIFTETVNCYARPDDIS